jgi:hypothetical protein
MFPAALCGVWTVVSCTRADWLGGELQLNYNAMRFSTLKRAGFLSVKTAHYGSIFVVDEATAKVAWSPKLNYVIETDLLPKVIFPAHDNSCVRMTIAYELDETESLLTVQQKGSGARLVFRREVLLPATNNDSLAKLFFTQVVFDYVIRQLLHHI